MNTENNTFKEWALLELFGHQRIAGLVSESKIGAGAFVRVDVPDGKGGVRFTKFYNPSAVYAITPVDEKIATELAERISPEPITRWDVPKLAATFEPKRPELPASGDFRETPPTDEELDEHF